MKEEIPYTVKQAEFAERRKEILKLRAFGWTNRRIAEKYGVSVQRIHAIVKKERKRREEEREREEERKRELETEEREGTDGHQ